MHGTQHTAEVVGNRQWDDARWHLSGPRWQSALLAYLSALTVLSVFPLRKAGPRASTDQFTPGWQRFQLATPDMPVSACWALLQEDCYPVIPYPNGIVRTLMRKADD